MQTTRYQQSQEKRILDETARLRRQRKQLEALEQDNFQEDPHANLQKHPKLPRFEDTNVTHNQQQLSRKKRKIRGEHAKQRFRKTFNSLLEEEQELCNRESEKVNYFSAAAPPSQIPARHFCAICGFVSSYTCVQCGARYCSIKCRDTHKDTRCLKWTV